MSGERNFHFGSSKTTGRRFMAYAKKGQVTIFVIVGILILIIGAFFIYLKLGPAEEQIQTEVEVSQNFVSDALPAQRYIEDCLEKIAKDGVEKIGLQGGALYSDDGTSSPRNVDLTVLDGGIFLRYNIHEYTDPDGRTANISYLPSFSIVGTNLKEFISSRFKNPLAYTSNSPELGDADCALQLRNNILETQGLKLNIDPNAAVEISLLDNGVGVRLLMPTEVKVLSTEVVTSFSEFSVHVPARLKKVREFSKEYIKSYLLGDQLPEGYDGMTVVSSESNGYHLVIVKDSKSRLAGGDYKFQFLIQKPEETEI